MTASLQGLWPDSSSLIPLSYVALNPPTSFGRFTFEHRGARRYENRPRRACEDLVARTRFELVISALRGRRPKPLDERAIWGAGNTLASARVPSYTNTSPIARESFEIPLLRANPHTLLATLSGDVALTFNRFTWWLIPAILPLVLDDGDSYLVGPLKP